MNIQFAARVYNRMAEVPAERVNMSRFLGELHKNKPGGSVDCVTFGCIAGWTVLVHLEDIGLGDVSADDAYKLATERHQRLLGDDVELWARELLEIDDQEAQILFYPQELCDEYADTWAKPDKNELRARVLGHFDQVVVSLTGELESAWAEAKAKDLERGRQRPFLA